MVLPYFWPEGEPMLRVRVAICVFLLIGMIDILITLILHNLNFVILIFLLLSASKFINLGGPFAYGKVVDNLQAVKSAAHWVIFYGVMRYIPFLCIACMLHANFFI